MTTSFGLVDASGDPKITGSGDWQSESRGTGLYKVTVSSANSNSVPTVTLSSNDLDSYASGLTMYINITDVGEDDDGRWYFGVALNDASQELSNHSFSFAVETP
jgi:hypothetical protein